MNEKWDLLYNEMRTDLERCWQLLLPELEQVEYAFKIAVNYWQRLKDQLRSHEFENTDEEINFYKNVKPKFTGHIEFLTIVYQSLLFIPDGTKDIEHGFWEQEEKRLARFIKKHFAFVNYYKAGCTFQDLQYFVAANYDLGSFIISKAYDMDGEFKSSHDHMVATLHAQEMYHEYVKKKLESFL